MAVNPRGSGFEVYVKRGERGWRVSTPTEAHAKVIEAEIVAALDASREPDMEAIRAMTRSGVQALRRAADLAVAEESERASAP